MSSHTVSSLICLFFLFCFSANGWSTSAPKLREHEPFFSYTNEEMQSIRALSVTQEKFTKEKLGAWEEVVYRTAQSRPNEESTRMMAYLFVAQRDFALLIYELNQEWLGNPDALITDIITLFYPHFRSSKPVKIDPYSAKVSQIVFSKVKDRFKREQKRMKDYSEKTGSFYWKEDPPVFGQRMGMCYPWLLNALVDFQAPSPPPPESIIWTYGLNQIRFDQACLNKEQRRQVYYWAGDPGPESGNWFSILNQDLTHKKLDLSTFLFIRAIFAMGYSDAMTTVFDSKYVYWVRRPHMMDPLINEMVRRPKHPSYPSAHSTTSAAAATILSHFFPKEKAKWRQLAIEAGNARVWAGLHYPIDNEQGLIQGEQVGKAVLERLVQKEQTDKGEGEK